MDILMKENNVYIQFTDKNVTKEQILDLGYEWVRHDPEGHVILIHPSNNYRGDDETIVYWIMHDRLIEQLGNRIILWGESQY